MQRERESKKKGKIYMTAQTESVKSFILETSSP
jgi:hypothetical protein